MRFYVSCIINDVDCIIKVKAENVEGAENIILNHYRATKINSITDKLGKPVTIKYYNPVQCFNGHVICDNELGYIPNCKVNLSSRINIKY